MEDSWTRQEKDPLCERDTTAVKRISMSIILTTPVKAVVSILIFSHHSSLIFKFDNYACAVSVLLGLFSLRLGDTSVATSLAYLAMHVYDL